MPSEYSTAFEAEYFAQTTDSPLFGFLSDLCGCAAVIAQLRPVEAKDFNREGR
jgi:hypothetical protein